jgi:carboxynorspermidine decarboxylase
VSFEKFDPASVSSPAYVVDRGLLRRNAEILAQVRERAGCKILLALKGFALFALFDDLRDSLDGVCASGLHEALLGREEFRKEVHTYGPAYKKEDLELLLDLSDHIVFNSFGRWRFFRDLTRPYAGKVRFGIRLNPEHREAETEIYDPSAPGSRLGVTLAEFLAARDAAASRGENFLEGITGFHVHNLCEQNADALERTVAAVENKFGPWIEGLAWFNLGGGHHITRADYDVEALVGIVRRFREKWGTEVILEPGEAIALGSGVLVAEVLDIVKNGNVSAAVLDVSATCHMPDVLEMPYRPKVWGAGLPGEKTYTYRLGGPSCLAGDVVGDYSFDRPLKPGMRIVFDDMAHYTMVKTTTFNGVPLPSIAVHDNGAIRVVKEFGYADFKGRLS